jgi:hypothetical protein
MERAEHSGLKELTAIKIIFMVPSDTEMFICLFVFFNSKYPELAKLKDLGHNPKDHPFSGNCTFGDFLKPPAGLTIHQKDPRNMVTTHSQFITEKGHKLKTSQGNRHTGQKLGDL